MHLLALFFPPIFGFGFILYFLPAILAFARSKRDALRVNDVAAHAINLSGLITSGGTHYVEYQLGTAKSNQLTVQVPAVF
jgi:hypothetical protein